MHAEIWLYHLWKSTWIFYWAIDQIIELFVITQFKSPGVKILCVLYTFVLY